jgi:hypothetical protein
MKTHSALLAAAAFLAGAAAAEATPITVAGSYNVTSTGSATITDLLANPFTLNLDVGVPVTQNFFTAVETAAGTSTITAGFTFTQPTAASGSGSGTDIFKITGSARHDALAWSNSGLVTVNFSDGAILDITLADESFDGVSTAYHGLTPTITFELVQAPRRLDDPPPTSVAEPGTLALLGGGLVGLVALRRRRA